MGDGCGAHACLIGENTTGAANAEGPEGRTDHSACYRSGRKGPLQNGPKGCWDCFQPQQYDSGAKQDVNNSHKRNQPLRCHSDPFGTSKKHGANQHRKDQAKT